MNLSQSRKAVGNATILTSGAAIETVLQFVFLLIAGRQLGPEEFGFYGYLISLVTIAAAVVHFGLPVIAVREIAQRPHDEPQIFGATFWIRSVFSIAFFLAAVLIAAISPLSGMHRLAVWLVFFYLLCLPFDLSFLFDARQMSRWDVPGRVIGRTVVVILLIVLWQVNGTVTVADVALCSSLLMLINVIIAWLVARKLHLPLPYGKPTGEVRRLLKESAPITWSNVVTLAYSQSLTIFVKWLSTALQTGFYALASRLLLPVLIFKGVIYRVLLPLISEVGKDRAALTTRLEKIFPALALVFMPTVAIVIPASQIVIVPLFGADYAGAVLPFQISISYLFFSGIGSAFGGALLASGDARTPTVGLTIGCAVSIGLSMILIPAYGAVGAACTAWIGEFVAIAYCIPFFLRI
ncbi:MAG: flippase, partial [Calditrichota bacterium]